MALTLPQVVAEWQKDCVIDESNVQSELFRTPNLHGKYLDYYVQFKSRLLLAEKKYARMAYMRKRYYRGELTQQELIDNGWDQYQGLKMSNSEFNQHQNIDPVLVDLQETVDMYKTAVSTLEYIMKCIQSREYSLKNICEYQRWLAG